MAQWIWKFGEFEIYHNALVHSRRTQYGFPKPCMWKVYSPDSIVRFTKRFTTQGGSFRLKSSGDMIALLDEAGGKHSMFCGNGEYTLPAGTYDARVTVSTRETFPCFYADGILNTDGTWLADDLACAPAPVGTYDRFDGADKCPTVFPFSYEPLPAPVKTSVPGGVLFDFGKETFARTELTFGKDGTYAVRFGESFEEVMDPEWCVIQSERKSENKVIRFDPQAFRYVFVNAEDADIHAEYEYLPMNYRGSFRCDEKVVNDVWDTAAYTFHLNTREFFLDGIKRDRWVWSADAYQSYFVNRYLFLNAENEKRTLIALGGKQPVGAYINTIMDYSYFWLIALMDYYNTYGDKRFLEQIYPQAKAETDFCLSRVSEDGFIRGRERDWVFIDWAPMDKTGALCAEQILLAKAMRSFAAMCRLIGKDDLGLDGKAEKLEKNIIKFFYDEEKRVFIDSYESGKRNVTRQSNLLAYLFLPVTVEMKKDIIERVVRNPAVRPITTPYFKFYENQVVCEAGDSSALETCIREYYGSMLALGATTLYEQYDPAMKGAEHYAMYGHPYEKSLCHAWSASPIYLLGRYRAGVSFTFDRFTVEPNLGDMKSFTCTVPLPGGSVSVKMDAHRLKVRSDAENGTLIFRGETRKIVPGEEIVIMY